jgi:hypothetical protein
MKSSKQVLQVLVGYEVLGKDGEPYLVLGEVRLVAQGAMALVSIMFPIDGEGHVVGELIPNDGFIVGDVGEIGIVLGDTDKLNKHWGSLDVMPYPTDNMYVYRRKAICIVPAAEDGCPLGALGVGLRWLQANVDTLNDLLAKERVRRN